MWGWLRRLFAAPPAPAEPSALRDARERLAEARREVRQLRARYDAAQTTDDNRRHWAAADGLSAASSNALHVRQKLRNRSRYESANNGYAGGIAEQYANDLTGTGPTLQLLGPDDDANSAVEAKFAAWCKAVGWGEKFWTMSLAEFNDGEALAVLNTNPALADPVKLDFVPVECDRLTDPSGDPARSPAGYDGIEYDAAGNPVAYTILREHPGDLLRLNPAAADRVPAKYVLHWFRRTRPGQVRGVPRLTASLPSFAQLRRWTGATLSAAEIAADFAALMTTKATAAGDDEAEVQETSAGTVPLDTVPLERGLLMALPDGQDVHQLKAEQPVTQYPDFKREIIAEGARPAQMPVNVALADSSKHNFSSAKLDHFGYRGGLRVDRSFKERHGPERLFLAWLEEARLIPGHLPEGVDVAAIPRAWYWPGWPSMDKDEAANDTERLNNGTATLSEILAEWGQDWRAVLRQRAKEKALARQLGLEPPPAPSPDVGQRPPAAAGKTNANGNGHHAGGLAGRL